MARLVFKSCIGIMGLDPVGASEFFLGYFKLLHNCKDHFHLHSISAVHSYRSLSYYTSRLPEVDHYYI